MENYAHLNYTADLINKKLESIDNKANASDLDNVKSGLLNIDSKNIKAVVDSKNHLVAVDNNEDVTAVGSPVSTWKVYISHLLNINSVYCGGFEESDKAMCSHNYVELSNASKEDINLNGLHLLYTSEIREDGYTWTDIPLTGVIKAGSAFVIRGKQVNNIKGSMIRVDSFDIDKPDMVLNQGKCGLYLCAGESPKATLDSGTNPWNASSTLVGYIDSCGFGTGAPAEGTALSVDIDWYNALFVRWYMFESAKQGHKAYNKRSTKSLWTYIDLARNTTKKGNSIQYYYEDDLKLKYAPKASYLGKNFFTISTTFKEDVPNYISMTFGRQATATPELGATRCFNWISVGYHDEFVEYRKVGGEWKKQYSIIAEDSSNDEHINKFINYYKRYKWISSDGTFVTTHKCIIRDLEEGNYEYRIRRDKSTYSSEIIPFKVEGAITEFSFVQTSDLQGFNWQEYLPWKKSAYVISQEDGINFTINTGDITLNGDRINEWLDYSDGREYLKSLPEMFTVGNNDLCGKDFSELNDGEVATSKYNHINVLRYFTFEMDENPCEVTYNDLKYPVYSVYSFNYGNYHFVSLNSETASETSKMYFGEVDAEFAKAVNAAIEDWFVNDITNWEGDKKHCIVYLHDAPFTIVTYDFLTSGDRKGSKLNTANSNGTYRFSRLFKKYGIRLVICGHKHTYAISKPIYDAPAEYITSEHTVNAEVDIMNGDALNRQPVIQVTDLSQVPEDLTLARYEVVSKIDAPTYVTCQATGYKLISNKELPAAGVPWLLSYFPAGLSGTTATENVDQHKPMYIRYDVTDDNIKITAKLIEGIWKITNGKTSFDFNNLDATLDKTSMTLVPSSEEDINIYADSHHIESYTITL